LLSDPAKTCIIPPTMALLARHGQTLTRLALVQAESRGRPTAGAAPPFSDAD
jgi:hypothetical protein